MALRQQPIRRPPRAIWSSRRIPVFAGTWPISNTFGSHSTFLTVRTVRRRREQLRKAWNTARFGYSSRVGLVLHRKPAFAPLLARAYFLLIAWQLPRNIPSRWHAGGVVQAKFP